MTEPTLRQPRRQVHEPVDVDAEGRPALRGWSAADLTDDELVDDDFIERDGGRVYEPLQAGEYDLQENGAGTHGPLTARYIVTFDDLVACARRTGAKVVAAPSSHRGHIGEMGTVVGVTCHYTGTSNSYSPSSEYPDYNVVKEGRAGLSNSLSAFGLGRRSTIYVFSEDLSWHAGTWSWAGITDGNGHFLGTEAAGVGDWTDWQRRMYPRLQASVLLFINAPGSSMAPTHAQGAMPRGRKVDFLNTSSGWLPDVPNAPHSFTGAIDWLMRNPAYININYRPGGTKPPAPKPVEDDMAQVDQKVFDKLVADVKTLTAGVERLQYELLERKWQRLGVVPEDTVQEATVTGMARYAEGNALRARRAAEALQQVQGGQPAQLGDDAEQE